MSSDKIKKIAIIVIIALIVLPLMKPGYMIGLDFVSDTRGVLPQSTFHSFFIYTFPNFLIHKIGLASWVLEKFFILLIYGLTGYYAYKRVNTWNLYADLFGILLLLLNPFIYGRFLDGQLNVTLMYVFMIPFLYHTYRYINKRNPKDIRYIGLWSVLLMLTSAHSIFMIIWSQILIRGCYILSNKKKWKYTLVDIGKLLSVMLLYNLIWIIPLLSGKNSTAEFVKQHIDSSHMQSFATKAWDIWLYSNVFAMRGYRWEEQYRFASHQPIWWMRNIMFAIIITLVLYGLIVSFQRKPDDHHPWENYKDQSLLAIAVMAYILGLGISWDNVFAPISQWLYDHVEFYKWLREPHKWILFLPIIYAYFGSKGVARLLSNMHKRDIDNTMIRYLGILAAISPILYMPKMLWWFAGQIHISDYPSSWYELRDHFAKKPANTDCQDINKLERNLERRKIPTCYDLLILPRHGYMKQSWINKITPAGVSYFISNNALIWDSVETMDFYKQSSSYESKVIEEWFGLVDYEDIDIITGTLMHKVKDMGIYDIIVLKTADYKSYIDKLVSYKDQLTLIKDDDSMVRYRIK